MTKPTISMYRNITQGTGQLGNLTKKARGWKHSIRDNGGFWQASFQFWTGREDDYTTKSEAEELFMLGLGRRVTANLSDRIVWEGFIHDLNYTIGGISYRRSMDNMANKLRAVYRKRNQINLLPNGSFETDSGYTASNSTVTWSTAWAADGTHSLHVQTDSSSPLDTLRTHVTLTIGSDVIYGAQYIASGTINVVSYSNVGSFVRFIITDDADQIHSHDFPVASTGEFSYYLEFDNTIKQTGSLHATIQSYSSMDYYIDNLILREKGTPYKTAFFEDATSQGIYGTIELDEQIGDCTKEVAEQIAQSDLAWKAYPRTYNPDTLMGGEDGLTVGLWGYVKTLSWKNTTVQSIQDASEHVNDLVAASEFISAGNIALNTDDVLIEDNTGRIWDCLETVINARDASYNQYRGGVYAGRKFNYELRPTGVAVIRKNGRWLTPSGVALMPCEVRTGLFRNDDLPQRAGGVEIDPRLFYVNEVEYDRDSDTIMPRGENVRLRLGQKPVGFESRIIGANTF